MISRSNACLAPIAWRFDFVAAVGAHASFLAATAMEFSIDRGVLACWKAETDFENSVCKSRVAISYFHIYMRTKNVTTF